MKIALLSLTVSLVLMSCAQTAEQQALEKHKTDSIQLKHTKDSLVEAKKKNPLIIIDPDSTYTGDFLDRYDNGIVKYRGYYRFGKRHGQWISFYPNGLQWSEMFYDKGVMSGSNTTYYANGKIRYKGFYKNNLKDSVWEFYDTSGVIIQVSKFKNDREISTNVVKK